MKLMVTSEMIGPRQLELSTSPYQQLMMVLQCYATPKDTDNRQTDIDFDACSFWEKQV